MLYYNYHKHDHYGNPWSLDVVVKPEDYCKRAVELGHNAVFTTNHGVQGNIFDWMLYSEQYDLKMIYGAEMYYVHDCNRLIDGKKDNSNKHIVIIAKNNRGAEQLNELVSFAHTEGFYYKPRVDSEHLYALNPHDLLLQRLALQEYGTIQN